MKCQRNGCDEYGNSMCLGEVVWLALCPPCATDLSLAIELPLQEYDLAKYDRADEVELIRRGGGGEAALRSAGRVVVNTAALLRHRVREALNVPKPAVSR